MVYSQKDELPDLLAEQISLWETYLPVITEGREGSLQDELQLGEFWRDFKELEVHLARQVRTPELVLGELSKSRSLTVRKALLQNPSTPLAVVEGLLQDDEPLMIFVASKSDLPKPILYALARSDRTDVLAALAANPTVPEEVLAELATVDDWDSTVSWGLIHNPSTPTAVLERFLETETFHSFRIELLAQLHARRVTLEVMRDMNHRDCSNCGTSVFVEEESCPACGSDSY